MLAALVYSNSLVFLSDIVMFIGIVDFTCSFVSSWACDEDDGDDDNHKNNISSYAVTVMYIYIGTSSKL